MLKDVYWTMALRSTNRSEIISDRYDWLQRSMLQDEVDSVCAGQASKYQPLKLGGVAAK